MAIHLCEHFTYKKLLRAVLPSVLMMVCISIYSIVDGVFVSNFTATDAFAGLNLIMPVTMMIGALGFMLGAGGSALTAMTLGQNKPDRANKIFSMVVGFTAVLGAVTSVIIFVFLEPIAIALGSIGGKVASQAMIDNAVLYGRILLAFEVPFMLQNVFQSFFVVAERSMLSFIITAIAGVTNMALDALFVAGFRWGIVGAAVATGISQTVGAVIPLVYFLRKNKGSLLRLVLAKFELKPLLKACTNGSSELLSNIAMSVVSILFNVQLLKYAGVNGVAAYGVIMYAGFIFAAVFIGYSIGVAPIIGYHYGAENNAELKNVLKKSLILTLLCSLAILTLTELTAGVLSSIFTHGDKALQALTTHGFRLYGISFVLCGFNIFASGFFTALNDGLTSAIVSFSRTAVFQVACVLVLPLWLGLNGIWLSIVVAELLSVCVSIAFLIGKRRKYGYG